MNDLQIMVDGVSYTQSNWEPLTIPNGPTGDAGITKTVTLLLPVSYAYHAGSYTGILTLDVRQY